MSSRLQVPWPKLAAIALFAAATVLTAACGTEGDGPAAPGDGSATPVPVSPGLPTVTPTPTPSPNVISTVKRPAQIEDVGLVATLTDYSQWVLNVAYGLPGGCARPGGYTLKESFPHQVDVFVELPADPNIACTKEYRIGTYEIPLGGGYEACKEYSIIVNGGPFRVQAISPVARCAAPTPGTGGIISGYDALFYALQSSGLQVERVEQPKEGFFEFAPRVLKVNGQTIDVYEFDSVDEAERSAKRVSADGTSYTRRDGSVVSVLWVAPAHFHLIANTITVYVGDDQNVIEALRNGAGPQFAGSPPMTGPTPTPHGGMMDVDAPIDQVDIVVLKSNPPQYVVNIASGLPNGCTRFRGYTMERSGNVIKITVTNTVPVSPDLACTMIYGTVQTSIELGSNFVTGTEYTVIVNDFEKKFTAG